MACGRPTRLSRIVVECDKVYVTAGLKVRGSSAMIRHFGRRGEEKIAELILKENRPFVQFKREPRCRNGGRAAVMDVNLTNPTEREGAEAKVHEWPLTPKPRITAYNKRG